MEEKKREIIEIVNKIKNERSINIILEFVRGVWTRLNA